jgi:hypothetical protein
MRSLSGYAVYLALAGLAGALVWKRDAILSRWAVYARIVVLCGIALGVLKLTDCPWFGDFESAYYPAGKLIFSAPNELYGSNCATGFVNLPLVAVLFIGLSGLTYKISVGVFTAVGVATVIATIVVLSRTFRFTSGERLQVISLFALNGPLYYSFREGNTTQMVLLLIALALAALKNGQMALAGVLLGVSAIIKIPIGLFGVYFLLRRNWAAFIGFAGSICAIVALSLLVHGLSTHTLWVQQCLVPYTGKSISGFNVQSVYGVLARLYGNDPLDWTPRIIGGSFSTVRMLVTFVLAGVMAFAFRRSGRPRDTASLYLEFSGVLILTLLISPISWTHYYLLLLLPLTLLVSGQITLPEGRIWLALASVATFAVSLPMRFLYPQYPLLRLFVDRILFSHYFLGGLLLFGILLWARRASGSGNEAPKHKGITVMSDQI